MSTILKEELRRAFHTWRWWLVAVLALATLAIGWLNTGGILFNPSAGPISATGLWMVVLYYSHYVYLAPLLAALPCADSLVNDRQQGFLTHIAVRCPYPHFLRARILANALAGATAVAGPAVLLFLFSWLAAPGGLGGQSFFGIVSTIPESISVPLAWIYSLPPLLMALALLAWMALFGAVYASLGLAAGALLDHPQIALAAPFAGFAVADYIVERSVRLGFLAPPGATLLPFAYSEITLGQIAFQLGALLLAALVVIRIFADKWRSLSAAVAH
jgi:hypothetical protein